MKKMALRKLNILLTGGNGFVGQHVKRVLEDKGLKKKNLRISSSRYDDLRKMNNCLRVTKDIDLVVHLAGMVGGIGFNKSHPGSMFYDNILMGINLIEAARINRVKKFVCIGTVCSYPKITPVPFKEENIWDGYPEETNAPYGLAKKALLTMLQAYRQQYDFKGTYLLPVNMYGPGDNFDPKSSHVVASLIKKIHDAKKNKINKIMVWGDGTASREFLYVEDAAKGIVLAAERYSKTEPINLGTGKEVTIKQLVDILVKIMGFSGKIVWDKSKPNGQPRRCLDVRRAKREFGFVAKTKLEKGLRKTVAWYERCNS
jgi:GDP-L-fucose synthase